MSEFDLIKRYFTNIGKNKLVSLGVGDDAAITRIPQTYDLVTTVDTLVSGVHFYPDADAESIGHKALAVNLSDLAAMAATPTWFTLSLTLPEVNHPWLSDFAKGMANLAKQYDIALIGGDTVRGPLSITIQACGFVEKDKALLRSGAIEGDAIYVTGPLGNAALALSLIKNETKLDATTPRLLNSLHKPMPKIEQGVLLRDLASSAIDISDGLLADLSHILEASGVGAEIILDDVPISEDASLAGSKEDALEKALYGGEDYELCFTVPKAYEEKLLVLMREHSFELYRIGRIVARTGIYGINKEGDTSQLETKGYDHFANTGEQ